jgi:uncharacterized integral membrane protein
VAAIAESISGAVIVLLSFSTELFSTELFPRAAAWVAVWGALILLSGIGLYFQIWWARATSVVFSVPTALMAMLALTVEGSDWEHIAQGLVFISGILVLYALGIFSFKEG